MTHYDKYSQRTGQDLVNNPDLALDPETAMFILVDGFKTGAFTGKKITDFINGTKTDFVGARCCINGTDRNKEIAKIAETYRRRRRGEAGRVVFLGKSRLNEVWVSKYPISHLEQGKAPSEILRNAWKTYF